MSSIALTPGRGLYYLGEAPLPLPESGQTEAAVRREWAEQIAWHQFFGSWMVASDHNWELGAALGRPRKNTIDPTYFYHREYEEFLQLEAAFKRQQAALVAAVLIQLDELVSRTRFLQWLGHLHHPVYPGKVSVWGALGQ